MAFTQDGKSISVETPLGKDVLFLQAFQGRERISGLFEFDLELLSEDESFAATDIVGKSVAFGVYADDGKVRPFGGFVSRFAFGGLTHGGLRRYRARVVPWFWFLTKRSNCRIFQDKTVVEIVEQVFSDAGFDAFETANITRQYPKYEYCVQLGETDADFVSRLLEEEGIFYYFRFETDRHVMVLADSKTAYADCATPEVEFIESEPGSDQVSGWEHRYEFISGKWSHTDFDFTSPQTDLFAESPTVVQLPGVDPYERYHYPGRFVDKSHGADKAKVRMEAEESTYDLVVGRGGCRDFGPGHRFTMARHPFAAEEQKSYVLTEVEHQAYEGAYSQGEAKAPPTRYENQFRCIPADVLFRPPRRTPKPVVAGPQTAIVVGPKGEEIYTDEYGRIKVQFHWDRQGVYDDKSSCWIRVAQATAGKKWGAQTLPRVNQEVVVEFLDGDPDRPLVTGAVYNAGTMPTYPLPEGKTQSGIKSRSSKDAPASAFNEIRFEDKKDDEHIFIHAQKDEHHRVVSDRHDHVGNDEHRIVVQHLKQKIDGDRHLVLGGDSFSKVGGELSEEVASDRKEKVGGAHGLSVGGDQQVQVGGDQGFDVSGGQMVKAGMDISGDAGMNILLKAGMNYAAEGGMNVHIKGGMNVVVEAGLQLTLKAGGAFVVLGPAGVDISGPMVKINTGGSPGSGSGCSPKAPGTPAAPDAPEEAEPPMEAVATQKADDVSAESGSGQAASTDWTAIENAPSTPQAASLESAAATGQPFCET